MSFLHQPSVSALTSAFKPANRISWLNSCSMGTSLQDRLAEVMAATGWAHADLMRVTGQSSSVVSQWLGKGSKIIQSIGKMEAAEAIERAAGFSALWVAKGIGPKTRPSPSDAGDSAVAHAVSHRPFKDPTLTREDLQNMGTLPNRFVFALEDDAMGAFGRAGTEVYFHTAPDAKLGAGVLVRDGAGELHVRRKSQGRGGDHWIAAAPNKGIYRDLDSEADQLTILAVWRGVVNRGLEDL